MHWGKLIFGSVILGIAFGYVFPAAFGFAIQICVIQAEWTQAFGNRITCGTALESLTEGMITPLIVWIFIILTSIGAWFLMTGIQSRSLITLKKQA